MIKTGMLALGLFISLTYQSFSLAATEPQVSLSDLNDTTHMEFSGLSSWDYDLQRNDKQSLTLRLPSLSAEAEKKLSSYKDNFIQSISIQRETNQVLITFRLAESDVEHFDYMTDQPSLLIVDVYKKPEELKPPVAKKEKPAKGQAKKKIQNAKKNENTNRQPASGELLVVEKEDPSLSLERRFGAFDASDDEFARFQIKDYEIKESSIIASKQNVYLKYPPLMMPVSRLDHWANIEPQYIIKPKDNKETKEALLLQTLYLRGREAVFLKTYQYFIHRYPESEYSEILKNLVAELYLKRWRADKKTQTYNLVKDQLADLVEHYPESPLTQRSEFILAYSNVERGESLPALERLQKLITKYPKSDEIPHLKFAQAEAYLGIGKFEEARAVYEDLIKSYPNTATAFEANYRLGDVAMRAQHWSQAEKDYSKSVESLKEKEKDYPNAHFNRGEALFWVGEYKAAVEEFHRFLVLFPTHPYGAYAMTRIGELFDILGADKKRVMGAYLESYYRYPNLAGAKIARIRMLAKSMKGMKEKAFEKAIKEMEEIQKEIEIEDINEFITLLIAGGHEDRGEFLESLNMLSEFYQKYPGSHHRNTIQSRVRKDIASEIKQRVEKNDYLGALKFYESYSKTWLRPPADRIDVDYLRAQSYEQAGVLEEALKLYKKVAQKIERIRGTEEEKERKVNEYLPGQDQLYLRTARVLFDLREYVPAYKTLKKVESPKNLKDSEQIERTQLMADLWIQRGEFEDASKALELLVKNFEGKDEALAPVLTKQAQVQNHLKRYEEALKSANRALTIKQASSTLRSDAYAEQVKAQLALGLKASAIATLQEQLTEFDGKTPTESIRFRLGELLYQEGDYAEAEKVWSRLKDSQASVLWKIAEEKIKAAQFNKNYSRYIDRIPAMSKKGE